MKEELLASKNTLVAARDALVASADEISQKNSSLEFLKKKLQESEAMNDFAKKQCRSVIEPIQPRGVTMIIYSPCPNHKLFINVIGQRPNIL